MNKLFFITLYILSIFTLPSAHANISPFFSAKANIEKGKADTSFIKSSNSIDNKDKVLEFYQNRNLQLAWFENGIAKEHARQLIKEVQNADQNGLQISRYPANELNELEKMVLQEQYQNARDREQKISQLDARLTDLFFEYAGHVNLGLLQPEDVNFGYYVKQKEIESIDLLEVILTANDHDPFQKLEPQHKWYGQLKNKLAEYRNIEKGGGWPTLTDITKLEEGDSGEVVIKLRERLKIEGFLQEGSTGAIYDSTLIADVKEFQTRHGLKVDGIVGPETLENLNITVEDKISKIILNMERLRWLPAEMGDPHLMVNIPEFMLYVNEGSREVMKMKVITGKVVNATVLFSDSIEYLEMSPYWNLPYSIATQEILPKVRANRGYLAANNYQVLSGNRVLNPYNINWYKYNTSNFPYRIRQTPGEHNSLGTIKFIFPNKFSIYLHDTPAKHLFDQSERDFSHGCIRVEDPLALGKYLLKDFTEWDEVRIQEYRTKSNPERVHLNEQVPVYILYFTSFVDEKNNIHFREDIYGHDQEMMTKFFTNM